MNNEQFKQSITQHIQNMYDLAIKDFNEIDYAQKDNPRSHSIKAEWMGALKEKQVLGALMLHINAGHYDDVEYYNQYLNPKNK